jgi:hypothetical protein
VISHFGGFPAAAGRNLTPVPHREALAAKRPQLGSPPGLQFRLQFNAGRHSPAKTDQGCWSSLNRSGLPRPELLMRLGLLRSQRLALAFTEPEGQAVRLN